MYELTGTLMGAYALDEMGQRLDGSKGREMPRTMADKLSRTVWEDWLKEEAAPAGVANGDMRSGQSRRLLWDVGALLVRGGSGCRAMISSRLRTRRHEVAGVTSPETVTHGELEF
jgi:hypothetical protein